MCVSVIIYIVRKYFNICGRLSKKGETFFRRNVRSTVSAKRPFNKPSVGVASVGILSYQGTEAATFCSSLQVRRGYWQFETRLSRTRSKQSRRTECVAYRTDVFGRKRPSTGIENKRDKGLCCCSEAVLIINKLSYCSKNIFNKDFLQIDRSEFKC